MSKALFVIDMQEATMGKNHAKMFEYPTDLLKKINDVIQNTDAEVVVYIRNLMKHNLLNRFAPVKCFDGTKEAELVEGLAVISENIFDKFEGNAFSNGELDSFLKANNITEVEIIGVDGGGCVSLTALGAVDAGYKVILNTVAIGTVFEQKKMKYFEKLEKLGAKFV